MALALLGRSQARQERREERIAKRLERARRLTPHILEIFLDADKAEEMKIALEKAPKTGNDQEQDAQWLSNARIREALLNRDKLKRTHKGHLLCYLTKGIKLDELERRGWDQDEIDAVTRMRQLLGMNPKTGRLTINRRALETVYIKVASHLRA